MPPKKQRRFNQLRRKLQDETISEREYEELLILWQEIERRNVERLKALIELAKLRGVSVQELIRREYRCLLSDYQKRSGEKFLNGQKAGANTA